MRDIFNDILHAIVGACISALIIAGVSAGLPWGPFAGFVGGSLVGILAEAKESNPSVFKADLASFSIRDILGYGIGTSLTILIGALL